MKTKNLIICAMMAAVMCVCSMFTIPAGIVSVTLSVFGVLLSAVILGWRRAAVATAVFILLGAVGLPVFSGMRGGLSMLAGPTGGYIYSYIPMAIITGLASDKAKGRLRFLIVFAVCALSAVICDGLGALHYMLVTKADFWAAFAACFAPFILLDCGKGLAAAALGIKVRKILKI